MQTNLITQLSCQTLCDEQRSSEFVRVASRAAKYTLISLDPISSLLSILIQVAQTVAKIVERVFSISRDISSHIAKALPWLGFINIPGSLYTLYWELESIVEGSSKEKRQAVFRFLSEIGLLVNYIMNCGIALAEIRGLPERLLGLSGIFGAIASVFAAFGVVAHYNSWQEAEGVLKLLQLECRHPDDYRRLMTELTNYEALERNFIKRHFCSESKFKQLYEKKLLNQFEQAFQSENLENREAAQQRMQSIVERLRQRVKVQAFSEKLQTVVHSITFVTGTVFAFTPFLYVGIGLGVLGAVFDATQAICRYIEKKRFEKFVEQLHDEPPVMAPADFSQKLQTGIDTSYDLISTLNVVASKGNYLSTNLSGLSFA